MSEEISIVDENDNIITCKFRKCLTPKDIYRVSALWIKNSKGEILLAKRVLTKLHNPGKWGSAVEGTVPKGESYKETLIREAEKN